MTETQNPNHRRPLAPGEIRSQWVGNQLFQVMHVSGGSFTQATVRVSGQPTRVLSTDRFEDVPLATYAYAIEQAEADYADADREDDTPEPLTAEDEEALRVRSGFAPTMLVLQQDSAPAPTLADDVAALLDVLIAMAADTRADQFDITAAKRVVLDRIAGAVPQRATDASERGVWRHTCGSIRAWDTDPDATMGCSWCYKSGEWRPLYTLGGE